MHKFAVDATHWLNISNVVLRLPKGLRSAIMSSGEYMSFNFGPLSNRCLANWSQYWLLRLQQKFVELWIRKEGLWVFMPCDMHREWHTQQQQHFFPLLFVNLEFLQWVISTCHIFFLTWAPPFQYLVRLQKHTTHLLRLDVTSAKKSVYILRSWVPGKDWSQEEEESNFNT